MNRTGIPLHFIADGYGLKASSPMVFFLCMSWVLRGMHLNMRTHLKAS